MRRQTALTAAVAVIVIFTLYALRVGAEENRKAAKVAILPIAETNAAAARASIGKGVLKSIRFQLTDRKEIELIDQEKLDLFLQQKSIRRSQVEVVGVVQQIGKGLGADFVLSGSCARYGSKLQEVTYIDFRIFDAVTGRLIAWPCERADLVDKATMTISSPAMEQMERLGANITAPIRTSLTGKLDEMKMKRVPVLVFPFKESTEGAYAHAVSRMFGTELMSENSCQALTVPAEAAADDIKLLLETARDASARFAFTGEVSSGTTEANVIRATQYAVENGSKLREVEESFTSDMELRQAVVRLAQKFAPDQDRILWRNSRFYGEPLFTTPVYAKGKLLIGAPGPAVVALNPFDGKEVWIFEGPLAKTIGVDDAFHTPAVWGETVCFRTNTSPSIFRCDLETAKKLILPGFFSVPGRHNLRDSRLVAGQELLFVPTGTFGLNAVAEAGEGLLDLRWNYSGRARLMIARAPVADRIVVASRIGRVTALKKSDGKTIWRRQLPDRIHVAPRVSGDNIYVACEDGSRHCLKLSDGKTVWTAAQKGRSLATPAVVGDRVYFSNDFGGVKCFNASNGKALWSAILTGAPNNALTASKDLLYASCINGSVYCLDGQSGKIRWLVRLRAPIHSAPVVVSTEQLLASLEADPAPWTEHFDHAVYLTTAHGIVYALGGNASEK